MRQRRSRVVAVTLATSLVLAATGAVSLVIQPAAVAAGVTPGVPPEIVVGPGDMVPKEYSTLLVGSAEVRSNPDECRDDPTIGLTCAAHRLKVTRASGYVLTIKLEWSAVGAVGVESPDLDLFLFDGPTAKFDSTLVGGAGLGEPEQLSITPEQDEYDIVVQAFAGAVDGYKITTYYSNKPIAAAPPPGSGDGAAEPTPDIVLKPHDKPYSREHSTLLATVPGFAFFPSGCRNNPESDLMCDVYRIKLHRNLAKDALNVVVVTLSWQGTEVPDPCLAVTCLGLGLLPDLDMYLYDQPQHSLEGNAVGGVGFDLPERLGWTATQDEYDIVIQTKRGAATSYKLEAFLTDEIFGAPFELLDPVTGEPLVPTPSDAVIDVFDGSATGDVPPLSLAPIGVDEQLAGIGLGTTERFDAADAIRLGRAVLRNTAATNEAPSPLILLVTLVAVPGALLGAGVAVLRRRRDVLF